MQKAQNLGNERRWIFKKLRQASGLYDNSYARYSEKRFTQIYKALYEDAMLVSLLASLRGTNMATANQQKHLFLSFTYAWIPRGILPYMDLMGMCGHPGYVFRCFCLKQGIDFIIFCLNQGINFISFCLKKGIFSWTINSLRVSPTN